MTNNTMTTVPTTTMIIERARLSASPIQRHALALACERRLEAAFRRARRTGLSFLDFSLAAALRAGDAAGLPAGALAALPTRAGGRDAFSVNGGNAPSISGGA